MGRLVVTLVDITLLPMVEAGHLKAVMDLNILMGETKKKWSKEYLNRNHHFMVVIIPKMAFYSRQSTILALIGLRTSSPVRKTTLLTQY